MQYRYLETAINAIDAQIRGTVFEGTVHVHTVNHILGKHQVFNQLKAAYASRPEYKFSEVSDRLPDPHSRDTWKGDVNVPSPHVRRQSLDLVLPLPSLRLTATAHRCRPSNCGPRQQKKSGRITLSL